MQERKTGRNKSPYPEKIRALREATGLTQLAFAKILGAARSMVAACESEEKPRAPSAALLISLGNLAAAHERYGDAMWFWQNAGVMAEGLLPAALDMLEKTNIALPVGAVTHIPEFPTAARAALPLILFDSRLLRNPYAAKYIVPEEGRILVLDTQQTDIWKLSNLEVAVLRRRPQNLEALMRAYADPALAKYSAILVQQVSEPSLHWGHLTTTGRDGDTLVALESRTALGLSQSHVLAVQTAGGAGRASKIIESQFFTVLGRVIAEIDLRGGPIPAPYTLEEFEKALEGGRKRPKVSRKRGKTWIGMRGKSLPHGEEEPPRRGRKSQKEKKQK